MVVVGIPSARERGHHVVGREHQHGQDEERGGAATPMGRGSASKARPFDIHVPDPQACAGIQRIKVQVGPPPQ